MTSWNDWDPLQEVVVGRMEGKPPVLHDEPATRKKFAVSLTPENRGGKTSIECEFNDEQRETKAAACVNTFVETLKGEGIKVLRPEITDFTKPYKHPDWEVAYQYGSPCPRDLFIKFGDLCVETHSGWRCRYFETQAYHKLMEEHVNQYDCRWVSMPKGKLTDDLYPKPEDYGLKGQNFNETVACVEAADIRRFGRDVFMQYGGFSNKKGFDWMRRLLKAEHIDLHHYTFKEPTKYYHIDTKLACMQEGTALFTPDHEPSDEMKKLFKDNDWNLVCLPARREVRVAPQDFTSSGLNMNVLVTKPGTVVADAGETGTVKFLREELGYDVITLDFSWAMEFGGAFNCWTWDIVREGGKPKKYFERM